MPIYEFKCRDCGTITENLVTALDKDNSCICRNCGSNSTERIMSRAAVLTGRTPAGITPGCGDGNGAAAGSWPGNDDYIKIKGQQ